MIDLSAIKGDGAGSQYTFLEAIYHGNILILSKSWTGVGAPTEFIHEHNCLIVSTPEDIKSVIEDEQLDKKTEFIISNANKILDKHLQINWDFNS